MATISLGRDAGLTWNGSAVDGVRDVTVSYATRSIEIVPFGGRAIVTYQTGYAVDLIVETIDSVAAAAAVAAAVSGAEIAVVAGGHTFTAVVTNVSDAQPLADVQAWSITMTKTQTGLRA